MRIECQYQYLRIMQLAAFYHTVTSRGIGYSAVPAPAVTFKNENVLACWCVLDVSIKSPSLAVVKNLSRPSVGTQGMGELFFGGSDLSVPVYDTFATLLVDTNLHLF